MNLILKISRSQDSQNLQASACLQAISLALYDNPKVNSKFGPLSNANPPTYTVFGSHNISVAVDTPGGLMVPNIKDVGGKNVLEIQQELMRVAAAAQQGKLALPDIQAGGTITLSNIGVIGTKDPRPILFDGQAVIGATGRTMTLPRYNAKMEALGVAHLSPKVGDHRHLDGAALARFSNSFKSYMEVPPFDEFCHSFLCVEF
eukprot:Skav224633  [mRNA]  locus=scaffold1903:115941:119121:+ [translate_table: standard]